MEYDPPKLVGRSTLSTGHDQSEKLITTDKTWDIINSYIEGYREFARKEGIKRDITQTGLTERESRELIRQRKIAEGSGTRKADERGLQNSKPSEERATGISGSESRRINQDAENILEIDATRKSGIKEYDPPKLVGRSTCPLSTLSIL